MATETNEKVIPLRTQFAKFMYPQGPKGKRRSFKDGPKDKGGDGDAVELNNDNTVSRISAILKLVDSDLEPEVSEGKLVGEFTKTGLSEKSWRQQWTKLQDVLTAANCPINLPNVVTGRGKRAKAPEGGVSAELNDLLSELDETEETEDSAAA
jgi:hypothetical protein